MKLNEELILTILREEGKELNVSELAKLTSIDISNMSRYIKLLLSSKLITERISQKGKIRQKFYAINNLENISSEEKKMEIESSHKPKRDQEHAGEKKENDKTSLTQSNAAFEQLKSENEDLLKNIESLQQENNLLKKKHVLITFHAPNIKERVKTLETDKEYFNF
jgi:DNA-binding transcriptional regulator GbsR (MarR family)